jgi:hypothetical protein
MERNRLRSAPLALTVIGLVGCASAPGETARTVSAEPRIVLERVRSELAEQGFQLVRDGPELVESRSGQAAPRWAACSPVLVSAGDDRRLMTSAERRRAEVRVRAAPVPSGTRVDVTARFDATYRNRLRGTGFERPCRSTGALERLLLAAAAA